jgi:small subunit ribosomal protein S15
MAKKTGEEVSVSAKELEEIVVSLANAGHSPSKIGLILRDEHSIKDFKEISGKTIQEVLKENELLGEIPEDLLNLIKRSVVLYNHLDKNKKDYSAKHGYELTVSKIRNLSKYYVKKGKLPSGWFYSAEKAALLVK